MRKQKRKTATPAQESAQSVGRHRSHLAAVLSAPNSSTAEQEHQARVEPSEPSDLPLDGLPPDPEQATSPDPNEEVCMECDDDVPGVPSEIKFAIGCDHAACGSRCAGDAEEGGSPPMPAMPTDLPPLPPKGNRPPGKYLSAGGSRNGFKKTVVVVSTQNGRPQPCCWEKDCKKQPIYGPGDTVGAIFCSSHRSTITSQPNVESWT